jgi:PAS domain S-box-containing protein
MSVPASGLFSRWFARPLILAGAVLLALFVAAGFLGSQYWNERRVVDVSLGRSRQVLDTIDRLRTIIANVESERRGYLLTLDPAYLKAYGVSDESVRRETQELQALVANDPLQSLRAGHLAGTVSAKLREIDDLVGTAHTSRLPGLSMIRIMDELRTQLDQMVDHERLLLADLEKRADALEQRKTWLIATAGVVITIQAGAALALARREARRRRKATEENIQLQSDLEERDRKIRSLVDANIIGIIIWHIDGRILDANDAFLRIVGYDRQDLVSGHINRTDLTPPEWRDRDAQTVADLKITGTVQPFEKEYFRKDRSRVTVLLGGTLFEEGGSQGVSFVLDLTERKRAEAEARESERRYREAEMELAHANRITTMGQLTASIAHEVKQPIASATINASAVLRLLRAEPPNLELAREAIRGIIDDSSRAGEVIDRIRAFIRKVPPRKDRVDINEAIREVIALTRMEAAKNSVLVQTKLADRLPLIEGDRVQLQQVMLNLIVNAIEAMSCVTEAPRELQVSTGQDELGRVRVAVTDTGPGLDPANLDRLFDAFYTTKPTGMGLGLAICRSIIEAHEGKLWASANKTRGAVFQFTLPPEAGEAGPAAHPEEVARMVIRGRGSNWTALPGTLRLDIVEAVISVSEALVQGFPPSR